jgi:hypothetical protein
MLIMPLRQAGSGCMALLQKKAFFSNQYKIPIPKVEKRRQSVSGVGKVSGPLGKNERVEILTL